MCVGAYLNLDPNEHIYMLTLYALPQSYLEGAQWTRGSILSCGLHHAAMVVSGDLYTWGATKNGK